MGMFSPNPSIFSLEWGGFTPYNVAQMHKTETRTSGLEHTSSEQESSFAASISRSTIDSVDLDSDLLRLKPPNS